jgi:hypothetical protein
LEPDDEEDFEMNPLLDYDTAVSVAKEMTHAAELLHRRSRVDASPPRELPSHDDEMARLLDQEQRAPAETVGA